MVAGKVTTVSVPCLFGGLDKKKKQTWLATGNKTWKIFCAWCEQKRHFGFCSFLVNLHFCSASVWDLSSWQNFFFWYLCKMIKSSVFLTLGKLESKEKNEMNISSQMILPNLENISNVGFDWLQLNDNWCWWITFSADMWPNGKEDKSLYLSLCFKLSEEQNLVRVGKRKIS